MMLSRHDETGATCLIKADSVVPFGANPKRLMKRDTTTTFIAVLDVLPFCDHDFGHSHTEERHRGTGHAQNVDILRSEGHSGETTDEWDLRWI